MATTDLVEPFISDLLEWIASGERSHAQVVDAWRTSCPRLPVWQEANNGGYIHRVLKDGVSLVLWSPKCGEILAAKTKLI